MRPIQRNEVLGIADYEAIREPFRARVLGEKKLRRVALGPKASALFENRDTVLLQIEEMLRTERSTREVEIRHEIDTYNQLLPGPNELSVTVMIEIPDVTERDAFLVKAKGFETRVAITIAGHSFPATWDKSRELDDRTPAVHYLKLPLDAPAAAALRSATTSATATKVQAVLSVDHPAYHAKVALPPETLVSLAGDFED